MRRGLSPRGGRNLEKHALPRLVDAFENVETPPQHAKRLLSAVLGTIKGTSVEVSAIDSGGHVTEAWQASELLLKIVIPVSSDTGEAIIS